MSKRPPQMYDTDELPITLEDGNHPAEKTVHVEEGECDQCGYDRIRVSQYAGEVSRKCMLCDASGFGTEEMTPPTTTGDRLRGDREHADIDGPLEKVGEYGGSRFSHGNELFRYTDGTGLMRYYKHGRDGTSTSLTSFSERELREILSLLEKEHGWVTQFVNDEIDGKQVRPAVEYNPNALHVARLLHGDVGSLWLYNKVRRELDAAPIHIPVSWDGVSV